VTTVEVRGKTTAGDGYEAVYLRTTGGVAAANPARSFQSADGAYWLMAPSGPSGPVTPVHPTATGYKFLHGAAPTLPLAGMGGAWTHKSYGEHAFQAEFGPSFAGFHESPVAALWVHALNTGSDGDVVALQVVSRAMAADTAVFGANIIVSGGAGLGGVAMCALELDIQPLSVPAAGSIGQAINSFDFPITTGLLFGALNGGGFDMAIGIGGVTQFGTAIAPGATQGGPMQWFVNSGGEQEYEGAFILACNTHEIAFGNVGNTTWGGIKNDASNRLKIKSGGSGNLDIFNAGGAMVARIGGDGNLYLVGNVISGANFAGLTY
jgi:hypothetical protein